MQLPVCVAALAALLAAGHGGAQSYPAKTVRYVVTGSAGSSTDAFGRVMAEGLARHFGRPFVVENRPGAGSNLGPEFVARAAPDGHTLLQMTISHAVNVTLYRSLAYDLVRDFAPVSRLATDPAALVVHPSLPVRSAGDLIRLARAQPGALNYASGGAGTFTFIAAELFNGQAGTRIGHVPYKGGGPALTAVIAGEVGVYFAPLGVALPHVHGARLRPLGVTTAQRVALTPQLPTVAESGLPGYEAGNWFGLMAPAKTPPETLAALNAAVVAVLRDPATTKRLGEMAYVPLGTPPDELAAHVAREIARLGRIVRAFNLGAD